MFGLQAAGSGSDLPEEWQALVASQASTLAVLLSRIQTTLATLRQRQAPAARLQALPAVGSQRRRALGDQLPSRDLSHAGRQHRGLGTGDTTRARA